MVSRIGRALRSGAISAERAGEAFALVERRIGPPASRDPRRLDALARRLLNRSVEAWLKGDRADWAAHCLGLALVRADRLEAACAGELHAILAQLAARTARPIPEADAPDATRASA